ncbi:MAG: 2-oxoacid:acceptor oxidoreductase family protein [Clostridia bacterium]|jgi:2-oxoglutarate ferredoxin oxidoreductase subunit gamma|nr:2-oxoacid:acceptor oxidoreductase family protein [Clostridia bacterium]MDH7573812.1 2-oxoacid:acceptor oxidoreductase family protein [Clostridia bacterium]
MSLKRLVLGGEGGQGVQTVAEVLAEAGYRSGLESLYIPSFGVEQRGGVSLAFVQLGDEPIAAPRFQKADVVVALSDRALERTAGYVGRHSIFIYESSAAPDPARLPRDTGRILPLPAVRLVSEGLHPRVFNILILGALVEVVGMVGSDEIKRALEDRLGYRFVRQPELRELNLRALEMGQEAARELLRRAQN